jgi:hypothetical protein
MSALPGAHARTELLAVHPGSQRVVAGGGCTCPGSTRRWRSFQFCRCCRTLCAIPASIDVAKHVDDPTGTPFCQATIYRDRRLSADTSIFPDFALERALSEIRSSSR